MTLKSIRFTSLPATLLSLLLLTSLGAHGQAVPAATAPGNSQGFSFPTASGTLHYSLSLSERATLGYQGQDNNYLSTDISGNLAYLSLSPDHPFSAIYSVGYLFGNGNEPSSQFHNLALSQVFGYGKWHFVVSDSLAYLPESAVTGLSGIPGLGDANLPPGQTAPFIDNAILNRNATRISNIVAGSATRQLTGKMGLSTSASFGIDRYVGDTSGGSGIEDNTYSVSEGLSRRIDARTSASVNYGYSRFSYASQNVETTVQTETLQFSRQLTRKLGFNVSAGPQEISSNTPLIPSTLDYTVSAGFAYQAKNTSTSANYSHGTTAGSGVVTGAISDSLNANFQRRLGRAWQASANAGYFRSHSLDALPPFNLNSNLVLGGFQVNRSISRNFSLYASYTAESQIDNGSGNASNVLFNGLAQIVGFGITYSPESIHLGHR